MNFLKPNWNKLFLILGNTCEPRGVLVGSNQAINSVEFDSTGTLILGTSNDYASRVWSISDHRLRVSSFYELFCVSYQLSIDNLEVLFWTKMSAKSKGKCLKNFRFSPNFLSYSNSCENFGSLMTLNLESPIQILYRKVLG